MATDLPITPLRDALVAAMKEHQTMVIIGETGSGKTTQIPQYILQSMAGSRVVVTQPRRIAAISNAKRVASEMQTTLGDVVGYSIRFENAVSDKTRLRYMTDGVLLREVLDDERLEAYDVVVIDEAHERTVGTDILLGLLKRCRKARPELKVFVMSATLDVEKFSDFFEECPIFQIPGRPFPVDIFYSRNTNMASLKSTYLDRAVETVLHIHKTDFPGDVLVFLTGAQEIDRACQELARQEREIDYARDVQDKDVKGMEVYGVYSTLETVEQRAIFKEAAPGMRKVVFATNIAQTSITIPGIVYVVDCGFVKQKMYDATTQMDALLVVPISKAAATQRAGRAGRTQAGRCYRLYSRDVYHDFADETTPEIQRTSLIDTILYLKEMHVVNVTGFDFLDPPEPQLITTALKQLYYLEAIDDQGQITPRGHLISHIPLSPFLARAVLAAADNSCTHEMLIIAAMLSVEHVWIETRNEKKIKEIERHRERLSHPTGDHLSLLNVYMAWCDADYAHDWCRKHYLHHRALTQARNIKHQLEHICRRLHIPVTSAMGRRSASFDPAPLVRSLCAAFFANTAKRQSGRSVFYQYMTGVTASNSDSALLGLHLHPSSTLQHVPSDTLEWVIYHDVVYTTRANMRHVTKVWNLAWVEPHQKRIEQAERVMLNGSQRAVKEEVAVSPPPPAPEPEQVQAAVPKQEDAKRKRDDMIAQARERALKRRAATLS
ncbi:hypothetical protein RI367_006344 [Sorochytrium milnesiophthora]